MDLQLSGKVALVTGASAGLGRAIARMLAAEGCRLAILARRRPLLEGLAAELPASASPLIIEQDICTADAAIRIRDAVLGHFGRCDILVNNAGGSRPQADLGSDAVWEEAQVTFAPDPNAGCPVSRDILARMDLPPARPAPRMQ